MAKTVDMAQRRELISQAAHRHWHREERQGLARRVSACPACGFRAGGGASSPLARRRRPVGATELRASSAALS